VLIVAGPFNGLGGSGNLPLRKRGENLEGLWGSLPHLSQSWGAFGEKLVSLCTICNQPMNVYESPSCDGISWTRALLSISFARTVSAAQLSPEKWPDQNLRPSSRT
jgi:hypothetical protein